MKERAANRQLVLHAIGRDGVLVKPTVGSYMKNVYSIVFTDELHYELSTYDKILTIFDDNENIIERLENVDEVLMLHEEVGDDE